MKSRPTIFDARKVAAIKVTEPILCELGFTGCPGRPWLYCGSSLTVWPNLANRTLKLDSSMLEASFDQDGHCSILDLLCAAYEAGREDGASDARLEVRKSLGLGG